MVTRTAEQARAGQKVVYDAYIAECPTRQLLDRIADKWASLVLVAPADGSRRYSELNRTITGVSQKMPAQTLRSLERDGLLTRRVTASVPVRVDYELTPLGRGLLPVMATIKAWAEANIEEVPAHREHYDSR